MNFFDGPLVFTLMRFHCILAMIYLFQAFANIDDYAYPAALDTQTIVIFILCVILSAGAITTLILSIRQRWVYV